MALLYSQNSRKLLLYNNNFKQQKSAVFKIFYDILYKNYISPEKAKRYFNVMRPENILDHLIADKKLLNTMVNKGWSHNLYISKFIKYLGKKYILFDYYNNNFYCGITDNIDNLNIDGDLVMFLNIVAISAFVYKLNKITGKHTSHPD